MKKEKQKIGVGDLVSAEWDKNSLGLVKKTTRSGWTRIIPEYEIEWFIDPEGSPPGLGNTLSWREKELTVRRRGPRAN